MGLLVGVKAYAGWWEKCEHARVYLAGQVQVLAGAQKGLIPNAANCVSLCEIPAGTERVLGCYRHELGTG